MLKLGQQLQPTANRSVPLKMRSDLIVHRRQVDGVARYVIKDPVSLKHFQFWEQEYALLEMLDGSRTAKEMQTLFEARFRPARLNLKRLESLHGQFFSRGLVLSLNGGQAVSLWQRQQKERSRNWQQAIGAILSMRFRGVNLDAWLASCDRWCGWFFHPVTFVASLLFVIATALSVILNWSETLRAMPDLHQFLTSQNMAWLVVAIVGLKVIHELAHGLACKHAGGECNEIGIMLFLFTPCLYCDVSDAWLIDSKWRRAGIAMAGIWAELVIAAICTWLWWYSLPGAVHTICLHVMLLGSIGTLLFNANPLLRYDGYFVLSDMLELPNLWERSRASLRTVCMKIYLRPSGWTVDEMPERSPVGLTIYALASVVYQWTLTGCILALLYGSLKSLRLEALGAVLVALLVISIAIVPALRGAGRWLGDSRRMRSVRKGRVTFSGLILALVLGLLVFVPLPCSLRAPCITRAANQQLVVAPVGGQLESVASEGSSVKPGEILAQLVSPNDQLLLTTKEGELARQQRKLSGLEARRSIDPSVGAQLTSTKEAIRGLESEIKGLRSSLTQLTIRSPIEGVIIAPPSLNSNANASANSGWDAAQSQSASAEVDGWSGTPLLRENLGCTLAPGQVLCAIAPSGQLGGQLEGQVYLTQSQVEWVHQGQAVTARLPQSPHQMLSGRVVEISATSTRDLPSAFAHLQWIPWQPASASRYESLQPLYIVRVEFDAIDKAIVSQEVSQVRIRVQPKSLSLRAWRLLSESFGWTDD